VADLAQRLRVVGVATHQRRHVEGHREPAATGGQDQLVALIGLLCVAEAGELADGPGAAAITGRVETSGEWELPGPADALEACDLVAVRGAVDRVDLRSRQRREVTVGDAPGARGRVETLLPALTTGLDLIRVHVVSCAQGASACWAGVTLVDRFRDVLPQACHMAGPGRTTR
jgi:hypothetical protein